MAFLDETNISLWKFGKIFIYRNISNPVDKGWISFWKNNDFDARHKASQHYGCSVNDAHPFRRRVDDAHAWRITCQKQQKNIYIQIKCEVYNFEHIRVHIYLRYFCVEIKSGSCLVFDVQKSFRKRLLKNKWPLPIH